MWPLLSLCMLMASRWLLEGALPGTASTLVSEGAGCVVIGGSLALYAGLRRKLPFRGSVGGRGFLVRVSAVVSILLAPALAAQVSGRHISSNNATLALALTPAVVAVADSVLGEVGQGDLSGLLWPGLAGITGLLLLLPQPAFAGWRPWLGLFVMPLLVGVGAVVLLPDHAAVKGSSDVRSEFWFLVFGCLLGGTVLCFWGKQQGELWREAQRACALDVVSLTLMFLALYRLRAVRWSAQFILIPLLGLMEGMLFLRPILDLRSWIGMGLIALGAIRQVLPRARATEGWQRLHEPEA